jgi:hypothetical protein
MVLVKYLLAHPTDLQQAFSAFETERVPRTTQLVQAARAQGERRVLAGEDACAQRDELVRHMYDNSEKGIEVTDMIYNESY